MVGVSSRFSRWLSPSGLVLLFIVLALPAIFLSPALARDYPQRTIRIVVPFPAGGGTDHIARTLAERLGSRFEHSVIVDNKPGGGTIIGSQDVVRSPADGHTLLLTSSAHAINTALVPDLPYDTQTSFSSTALIAREPIVLVAHADRPYSSVSEVLEFAKKNSGGLTYGSSGNGTAVHLAGELFKSMTGANLLHIPYRGGAPAAVDLLGGQIDLAFATFSTVGEHIRSGRVKAIGVTSKERSALFPDVPTIAESGVPGYVADIWYATFVPAGTPDDVIETLNAEINASLQDEALRERFDVLGLITQPGTPRELSDYVLQEEERWTKVVESAGIRRE